MQKIKAERSFCPQAFTLARRSAGPWLFLILVGEMEVLLLQKSLSSNRGKAFF